MARWWGRSKTVFVLTEDDVNALLSIVISCDPADFNERGAALIERARRMGTMFDAGERVVWKVIPR